MNDLEAYFFANKGRVIHKWHHYFEIYDRHFSRFRGKPITVVEIGVYKGGSLRMWKDYFGAEARIVGIDIDPGCRQYAEEQVDILIGDQADRGFLKSIAQTIPKIDVLIDDGGHTMIQQITTFEELYPHVDSNGVYLCEDLHTSYWQGFGGGYRSPNTFIEYSKQFIDRLNAWHSHEPAQLSVSEMTRTTHSLHYYDSVLVLEKRPITPPQHTEIGIESQ